MPVADAESYNKYDNESPVRLISGDSFQKKSVGMMILQKKICLILLGYLLILVLVGVGLGIKSRLVNLPLLEEAVIYDIIAEELKNGTGPSLPGEESGQLPESQNLPPDGENKDYWHEYHKSENLSKNQVKSELAQFSNRVSTGDKLKALYIIKKNLGAADINYIISLIKDGITAEEQAEIRALLRRKLDPADQKVLKEMVLKYI